MEQIVILCDNCGARDAKSFSMLIGDSRDGHGRLEDDYRRIDLCPKCQELMLKKYMVTDNKGTNYEMHETFFNYKTQEARSY